MAKCIDCLHYNACVSMLKAAFPKKQEKEIKQISTRENNCRDFKLIADFVEVVKCKDCKYQDDCTRQMVHTTRDYVLEQNISTYNKVDFCSYGERKDT